MPGLNVVQTGGPGGQTSVFMRGTNSNHVKVLIDGIDVSDPSNPNRSFDFGQLLTADIERIEVLRGPQSGLYGADAIGGVISIITKKGEGPPKATATVEGGSFGTFNQTASLSGGDQADQLCVQRRAFPRRQHAGDAARAAAAGPSADQRLLRQLDLLDQARRQRQLTTSRSTGWGGSPTPRCISPATISRYFPSVPAAVAEHPGRAPVLTSAGKRYGRRSTAASMNYFGVNYTDTLELEQGSRPGGARRSTRATAPDTTGAASLEPLPGQFLIIGLRAGDRAARYRPPR